MKQAESSFSIVLRYMQEKPVPIDLDALCSELGIQLDHEFLDDDVTGELENMAPGRYRIVANISHSQIRRRFTIAHMIGHYIHHRSLIDKGTNDNKMYRSNPNARLYNDRMKAQHEHEASNFAATLLMPNHEVAKHMTETTIEKMAAKFGVSKGTMKLRISSLSNNNHVAP